MPRRKTMITQLSPHEAMLQFVSRSQLAHNVNALEEDVNDQAPISQLLEAIQTANYNHSIFENPNCTEYALILLKKGSINAEECSTLLTYLMALAQYTTKQNLREEDSDLKIISDRGIKIYAIIDPNTGALTATGFHYLLKLTQTFNHGMHQTSTPISLAKLLEIVKSLPLMEQSLFGIPFSKEGLTEQQKMHVYFFPKKTILHYFPFCQALYDGEYLIPSSSFFSRVMSLINPDLTITPIEIFGNISPNTLLNLHEGKAHPVNNYSTHVKSNPPEVHEHRCGPLLTKIHDLLHIYMGSKFKEYEYRFIFDYLIPILEEFDEVYGKENVEIHLLLTAAIENLADLDIIKGNTLPRFVGFYEYTHSCLSLFNPHVEFLNLGKCSGDQVYYLLIKRMLVDYDKIISEYGEIQIFNLIRDGVLLRQNGIKSKIEELAAQEEGRTLFEAIDHNKSRTPMDAPTRPNEYGDRIGVTVYSQPTVVSGETDMLIDAEYLPEPPSSYSQKGLLSSSKLLVAECFNFWKAYVVEHRHEHKDLQELYDRQFGLVLKR